MRMDWIGSDRNEGTERVEKESIHYVNTYIPLARKINMPDKLALAGMDIEPGSALHSTPLKLKLH